MHARVEILKYVPGFAALIAGGDSGVKASLNSWGLVEI